MALTFIGENNSPNYIALSSDIVDDKIEGASMIGGTVLLTDVVGAGSWKILDYDLSLKDYGLPVAGGGSSSKSGRFTILPYEYSNKGGSWNVVWVGSPQMYAFYIAEVSPNWIEYTSWMDSGIYTARFLTPKNTDGGDASVSIDGNVVGTVSLYSPSLVWNQNTDIEDINISTSGIKTIRISVTSSNTFYWTSLSFWLTAIN